MAGGGPGHFAGLVLGQCPAGDLFRLVMVAAERCHAAFASAAAEVVRDGVVERAATYGGKLEAGPRPQGGWRVHLRLDPSAEGALR